jgi:hypothetical protein
MTDADFEKYILKFPVSMRERIRERAAIKQYLGNMPRVEAEHQAVEEANARHD